MRLQIPEFTTKQKKIALVCVLAGGIAVASFGTYRLLHTEAPISVSTETPADAVEENVDSEDDAGSFVNTADFGGTFVSSSNTGGFAEGETMPVMETEPIVFTPKKQEAETSSSNYDSTGALVVNNTNNTTSGNYGEYTSQSTTNTGDNGWKEINGKMYFYKNGKPVKGWMHLKEGNGRYCYFSTDDGHMLVNMLTPDGYFVGADGIYIMPQKEGLSEFTWDKPRNAPENVSGLIIAGKPAEFYMLCIGGENSGLVGNSAGIGDSGKGYGIIAFDYRGALVPFMKYAYKKNPALWAGFAPYVSYKAGDKRLVNNADIKNTILNAMKSDFTNAVTDQLEYGRIYYFDETETALRNAGIDLDARPAAVSGAIFSVNINCGQQPSVWTKYLSNSMSDEEMIRKIYELRNTVFAGQSVGSVKKGTTTRYMTAEPAMAMDLLYGQITIDSDVTYGGGVEWHGNPLSGTVSTTKVTDDNTIKREKETAAYEEPEKPTDASTETQAENKTSTAGPVTDNGKTTTGQSMGPGYSSSITRDVEIIAKASGESQ